MSDYDYDSDTSITDNRAPASVSVPSSEPAPSTSTSKSPVNNQLGRSEPEPEPVHTNINADEINSDKVKESVLYLYNKVFANEDEKFTTQYKKHKSNKSIKRIRIRRKFVSIEDHNKVLKKVKKLKKALMNSYENQKEDAKIVKEDCTKLPTVLKMNNSTQNSREDDFAAYFLPPPHSTSNSTSSDNSKSKSNLENETFGPKLSQCECPCFCGHKLDETTRIANLYHLNFVKRPK